MVENSVIEIGNAASNPLMFDHLKLNWSVWKPKKLKMIEGNLGKRIKPRHGPGLIKRTKYNEGSVVHGGPKVMPSIRLYNSAWEMNRTTPYDDRVVVIINIYWARPWPFSPFFDWYKASVRSFVLPWTQGGRATKPKGIIYDQSKDISSSNWIKLIYQKILNYSTVKVLKQSKIFSRPTATK